jgi:hypothetical protein
MSNENNFSELYNNNITEINNILSSLIIDNIDNYVTKAAKDVVSYSWGELDSMIHNTEVALGYVTGTLRTYFYSFFGVATVYTGMKDYSWLYAQNLTKAKVINELNHLMSNFDLYYRNFTPFVENLYIPSIKLLFDKAKELHDTLYFFIKQNNDYCKDLDSRLTELNMVFYNFLFSFRTEVTEIVKDYFKIWYDHWNMWIETHWNVLLDELESYQADYNNFKKLFYALENKVENISDRIEWVIKLLEKPVTNFLKLKTTDNELYKSELYKLREVINDAINLNYTSISDDINNNVNVIIKPI